MRQWIDLTNEAQHSGTREISLECAEERSSVDRPDLVCSFHNTSKLKMFLNRIRNDRKSKETSGVTGESDHRS